MSGPPTNCCSIASRQHSWLNCGKASTCSRVGMSSITGVEGHYPNAQGLAIACRTTGRFEITPEMLQVWDGNGRKLLCADADTLTRGASQPGRFAFIHRDNGM